MLPIEQLQDLIQGKKVAFIGAGVSHKRCIEQFVELGAQVTLCDQKKSLEDFGAYADTLRRLHVRLSLGEHYTDGFAGQDIIMRTPGYEYYKPELQAALQAGTKVTSEVELFFELCPCEIVAVTGSDGKTTSSHQLMGRPLMSPAQMVRIQRDTWIVEKAGYAPMKTHLEGYWKYLSLAPQEQDAAGENDYLEIKLLSTESLRQALGSAPARPHTPPAATREPRRKLGASRREAAALYPGKFNP